MQMSSKHMYKIKAKNINKFTEVNWNYFSIG
jgi:hypothetical protein